VEAGLTQSEFARRLSVSTGYVGQIEAGTRIPSDSLVKLVREIAPRLKEESVGYHSTIFAKGLPVLAWHELATWNPADKSNSSARRVELPNYADGIVVEADGNAMAPIIEPGDWLVVSPASQPTSGQIVVVKLLIGDVILRKIQRLPQQIIRLYAEDPRLKDEELNSSELAWVWPVCAVWRTFRKHD
jgi:SOS-response transcriptional repressor LexA